MVSNALSKRRGPLRRPKVCKASPNPGRCHPPPPPVPWPATDFDFYFEYTYPWMVGPETESWTMNLSLTGMPWIWWNDQVDPDHQEVMYTVDIVTETVYIWIDGYSVNFGPYFVSVTALPLVWGVQTPYTVTTWDTIPSGFISAKAQFLF